MLFVDTNVLIDLINGEGAGAQWPIEAFAAASSTDRCCVNPVIAAEISPLFGIVGDVRDLLMDFALPCLDPTLDAAFRAGKAHLQYRRAGGRREAILADLLIGAHAVVLGAQLLTRDKRRFATYFPELVIIAPEDPNG